VQSRNVVFKGDKTEPDKLAHTITQQVEKDFDFDVHFLT
jgi:uncharacterized protein (DUF1697 family)